MMWGDIKNRLHEALRSLYEELQPNLEFKVMLYIRDE